MSQKQHIEVGSRELTLSNLEKVYFPESGFTKGRVIEYYAEAAKVILPHLHNRPRRSLVKPQRFSACDKKRKKVDARHV